MSCKDSNFFTWQQVADNSEYELSVTCPSGATAFARFDEGGPTPPITWRKEQISPGPKKQRLGLPGQVHIVRIHVFTAATTPVTVRVEAKVTPSDGSPVKKFCREFKGSKGATDIITHAIAMA